MTATQIATLAAALEVKRNTDAHIARRQTPSPAWLDEQKRANERYYTLAAKAPPELVAAIEACLEVE